MKCAALGVSPSGAKHGRAPGCTPRLRLRNHSCKATVCPVKRLREGPACELMPRNPTVTFVCNLRAAARHPAWGPVSACRHGTPSEYAVQRNPGEGARQAGRWARRPEPSAARARCPHGGSQPETALSAARLGWDEYTGGLGGGGCGQHRPWSAAMPGVGKSTLLMQAAHQVRAGHLGRRPRPYVSGEESKPAVQLARTAGRVARRHPAPGETDLDVIAKPSRPPPGVASSGPSRRHGLGAEWECGSGTPGRESAARLMRLAKRPECRSSWWARPKRAL